MKATDRRAKRHMPKQTQEHGVAADHERLPVKTVIDALTDRLREEIVGGDLAPGERLVERKVATAYGVSTISVREALARLAEDGLVTRVPRRGAVVSPIPAVALRDLTRVRIVLEQLAVELAMLNWSQPLEKALRSIITEMRYAGNEPDPERLLELDLLFHRAFLDAAGSEVLTDVLTRLGARLEQFLRHANTTLSASEAREVAALHKCWLDAAASGDVRRAKAEVEHHIAQSCEALVARVERQATPL